MATSGPRYAIYLAPPADSALWRFGSAILGYDAQTGEAPAPPDLAGFDAETWHAATAAPRRYGFHGTLKAPFRLAEGRSVEALTAAVAACAAGHHPFEMPPLDVRALGPFIALVPQVPAPKLADLAAACVQELEAFRAPLTPQDIARRGPDRLSARQMQYLETYGYPYVLEEFRFHMTLTGPLREADRGHALNALNDVFHASGAEVPGMVSDLALYVQETPEARFRIAGRFAFGGRA